MRQRCRSGCRWFEVGVIQTSGLVRSTAGRRKASPQNRRLGAAPSIVIGVEGDALGWYPRRHCPIQRRGAAYVPTKSCGTAKVLRCWSSQKRQVRSPSIPCVNESPLGMIRRTPSSACDGDAENRRDADTGRNATLPAGPNDIHHSCTCATEATGCWTAVGSDQRRRQVRGWKRWGHPLTAVPNSQACGGRRSPMVLAGDLPARTGVSVAACQAERPSRLFPHHRRRGTLRPAHGRCFAAENAR